MPEKKRLKISLKVYIKDTLYIMYCKSHSKYTLCFLLQILVKPHHKFTVKNYNTLSIHHTNMLLYFINHK